MSAVLEARALSAGYGGVPVVRDLDLEVAPGEIVALLGRNGAGKTTALLTLAGDLPPIAGEVRLFGSATRAALDHRARRGLALVTDDRAMFMTLTARENIRLARHATVQRVLHVFPELEPHLALRAGMLSGGQQQMLALGRALASEPRILLVDELSLGLAPIVVKRLLAAVRAAADRGTAVLIVEQHARVVLGVADRACLLVNGRVAITGSAAELRQNIAEVERSYLAVARP